MTNRILVAAVAAGLLAGCEKPSNDNSVTPPEAQDTPVHFRTTAELEPELTTQTLAEATELELWDNHLLSVGAAESTIGDTVYSYGFTKVLDQSVQPAAKQWGSTDNIATVAYNADLYIDRVADMLGYLDPRALLDGINEKRTYVGDNGSGDNPTNRFIAMVAAYDIYHLFEMSTPDYAPIFDYNPDNQDSLLYPFVSEYMELIDGSTEDGAVPHPIEVSLQAGYNGVETAKYTVGRQHTVKALHRAILGAWDADEGIIDAICTDLNSPDIEIPLYTNCFDVDAQTTDKYKLEQFSSSNHKIELRPLKMGECNNCYQISLGGIAFPSDIALRGYYDRTAVARAVTEKVMLSLFWDDYRARELQYRADYLVDGFVSVASQITKPNFEALAELSALEALGIFNGSYAGTNEELAQMQQAVVAYLGGGETQNQARQRFEKLVEWVQLMQAYNPEIDGSMHGYLEATFNDAQFTNPVDGEVITYQEYRNNITELVQPLIGGDYQPYPMYLFDER